MKFKVFFERDEFFKNYNRNFSANSPATSPTETSKRGIMLSGNTQNDGLILPTSYASALCLMLGATHLVTQCVTLVEQSSSARLQASLQTRSASIIWRR